MQRNLLALITLACFPAAAAAGWDVEFAFDSERPATYTDEPKSESNFGNPLTIDWNVLGVEEVVEEELRLDFARGGFLVESSPDRSHHSYLERKTRFVPRTDTEAYRDVARITAGAWPLTPRHDDKSTQTDFQGPIVESFWPLTRLLFQPYRFRRERLGC
jgi:hypothetical protein